MARTLLPLFFGSLALYVVGAGGFDLLTDDEVRYAEAGRQMLHTGDWVVPSYNGEPRYQKPILFYWLQAASQALLGSTPFAARLPAALSGALTVVITGWLGLMAGGRRVGWWSGVGLAVTGQMVLASRMALTDTLLLLCVQGALAACLAAEAYPRRARWFGTMFHVALGLGLLAKGPVAVLLPFGTLVPWLAWRGELTATLRRLSVPRGMVVTLLVAGPWYWAVHLATEGAFTTRFLTQENLMRFTRVVNDHHQPPWFFLALLPCLVFPWATLIPTAWRAAWPTARPASLAAALPALWWWQATFMVLFFSLSGTKVWTYVLPMQPALALLLAQQWEQQRDRPRTRAFALGVALWAFLAVMAVVGVSGLQPEHLPPEGQSWAVVAALQTAVGGLALAALTVWFFTRGQTMQRCGLILVVAVVAWYLLLVAKTVPEVDRAWREPIRELLAEIARYPHARLATFEWHDLGLNYLARRDHIHHRRRGGEGDLARWCREQALAFVLVESHDVHRLSEQPWYVWRRVGRLVLLANYPRSAFVPQGGTSDALLPLDEAKQEQKRDCPHGGRKEAAEQVRGGQAEETKNGAAQDGADHAND